MGPMGLQAALIDFHLDDDGVGEELSDFLNFMMQFGEPEDLLQMCANMKEEGNLLFKKNLYEEALSKYDKATKLLCFALIENEEQTSSFCDLAISLNLNLALCAIKLNLFAQGRELCSFVLNFNPGNVKALYRRAFCSKGMNNLGEAKKDLTRAAEYEPQSVDVVRELNSIDKVIDLQPKGKSNSTLPQILEDRKGKRVKSSVELVSSSNHGSVVEDLNAPIGLGAGLPSPMKFNHRAFQVENISNMDNERDQCVIRSGSKSCISEDVDMTSHVHEEDVISVRFCNKIGDPSNGSSVNHANDSLKYGLSADHAEPKYRFRNRHRRQGSFLSISKKDYKIMAQGKPIHYYDMRSGSYLVVKAVNHPKEKTTSRISVSLEESRRDQEEVHEGVCSKEEDYCSEVSSTVTSGIDSSSEEEGIFSSTKDDFSTNPITLATSRLRVPSTTEISMRRKSQKTGRRSTTIHQKDKRRRKTSRPTTAIHREIPNPRVSFANFAYVCRSQVGKKRKFVNHPMFDSPSHPRKKSASFSSYYMSTTSSHYYVSNSVFQCCKSSSIESTPTNWKYIPDVVGV